MVFIASTSLFATKEWLQSFPVLELSDEKNAVKNSKNK